MLRHDPEVFISSLSASCMDWSKGKGGTASDSLPTVAKVVSRGLSASLLNGHSLRVAVEGLIGAEPEASLQDILSILA